MKYCAPRQIEVRDKVNSYNGKEVVDKISMTDIELKSVANREVKQYFEGLLNEIKLRDYYLWQEKKEKRLEFLIRYSPIYLSISYEEKEYFKRMGAKWSIEAKRWYIDTETTKFIDNPIKFCNKFLDLSILNQAFSDNIIDISSLDNLQRKKYEILFSGKD